MRGEVPGRVRRAPLTRAADQRPVPLRVSAVKPPTTVPIWVSEFRHPSAPTTNGSPSGTSLTRFNHTPRAARAVFSFDDSTVQWFFLTSEQEAESTLAGEFPLSNRTDNCRTTTLLGGKTHIMSYVLTIKRAADKPLLSPQDFERLVKEDASLSGGRIEPIYWTSPTGVKRYINIESDNLWTDDVKNDEDDQFLNKLCSIARCLDARVFGEEGEDVTDQASNQRSRSGGCATIVVGAIILITAASYLIFKFI